MRLLGVTTGLSVALGCASSSTFICSDDGDCPDGRCESNGYCSFPSDDCGSGWAYGSFSAPMLAGTCVDGDAGTESASTDAPTGGAGDATTTNSSDPSAGVSSSPTLTSGADTTSDTGANSIEELCEAYALLLSRCIGGGSPGKDIGQECLDAYYGYVAMSGPECSIAFVEVLACLSALDCEEVSMMGKSSCQEELMAVTEVCEGTQPGSDAGTSPLVPDRG